MYEQAMRNVESMLDEGAKLSEAARNGVPVADMLGLKIFEMGGL